MVRFELTVDIARTRSEVFAYITDPATLHEWQGVAEVEQLTPGPVREGTRFREVHERMGRRIQSVTEITGYDPDTHFAVTIVEGPLPIDGEWNLALSDTLEVPADGVRVPGTELHFFGSGELSGPMRLLTPLVARAVRRQMRKDHQRLKQVLEFRS